MNTTPEELEENLTPEQREERQQAYQDAVTQLGTSIGMGLVPYLGQAIDLYDTIEALVSLGRAETPAQKDDAHFDTLLAIIGWVPGPGDGVKKSLRIVNQHPDRYAPMLFDLLREVLMLCNIKTSPEVLLDRIFNESKIKQSLGEIRTSITDSRQFKWLPESTQQVVIDSLQWVTANSGLMVGVVQRRLIKWKRRKPNSSARGETQGRKHTDEPGRRDSDTGAQGQDRKKDAAPAESVKGQIATASAEMLDNALTGIIGEHIADYHCYEVLRWGSGWDGHDKGTDGTWATKPGRVIPGKLSNNTKLFRLSLSPHGKGIDAVWRVDSHNGGKSYAIVEAKASAVQPKPTKQGRKPSITSRLNVSNLSPKSEDLLEPAIESEGSGKRGGGKAGRKSRASRAPKGTRRGRNKVGAGGPIIQMSHQWIEKNIKSAVLDIFVLRDFKLKGKEIYNRHLFYIPIYTPSAAQHASVLSSGQLDQSFTHTDHSVEFHYDESEVKQAVNKKKMALRAKHGGQTNLKHES